MQVPDWLVNSKRRLRLRRLLQRRGLLTGREPLQQRNSDGGKYSVGGNYSKGGTPAAGITQKGGNRSALSHSRPVRRSPPLECRRSSRSRSRVSAVRGFHDVRVVPACREVSAVGVRPSSSPRVSRSLRRRSSPFESFPQSGFRSTRVSRPSSSPRRPSSPFEEPPVLRPSVSVLGSALLEPVERSRDISARQSMRSRLPGKRHFSSEDTK